ncbi:COPII subunit [Clydaea vesicula]|uniref:COPII subunit n=1 Tax=Clydaea vesicula TaxID=447962 RepID=A0AAD5U2T6_9FUNG|nr:COPII subunit [Clydaea vesicula]
MQSNYSFQNQPSNYNANLNVNQLQSQNRTTSKNPHDNLLVSDANDGSPNGQLISAENHLTATGASFNPTTSSSNQFQNNQQFIRSYNPNINNQQVGYSASKYGTNSQEGALQISNFAPANSLDNCNTSRLISPNSQQFQNLQGNDGKINASSHRNITAHVIVPPVSRVSNHDAVQHQQLPVDARFDNPPSHQLNNFGTKGYGYSDSLQYQNLPGQHSIQNTSHLLHNQSNENYYNNQVHNYSTTPNHINNLNQNNVHNTLVPQFSNNQHFSSNTQQFNQEYNNAYDRLNIVNVNQISNQLQNLAVKPAPLFKSYSFLSNNPPPMDNIYKSSEVLMDIEVEYNNKLKSLASAAKSPFSNAAECFMSCTVNAMPYSLKLLEKTKIPLGLVISPFNKEFEEKHPIPVINPEEIVRCHKCRTYINPWITFVDQGRSWRCNLCFASNELPSFFDWDSSTNQPANRLERPELTHGVIEFIAPQEYMIRPPQPVVLLFIIDVSLQSIKNGMLKAASKIIFDSLSSIPNVDGRTKVGFITVDSSIHFYNLSADLNEPQMLVISDIDDDDPYLPLPMDLLGSLDESRSLIENLLDKFMQGNMFSNTPANKNCLGKALKFGYKLLNSLGGKMVVLQSTLPNINEGSLKTREDSKLYGTAKEAQLLLPATQFYKSLALDCSRSQICIDLFIFNGEYNDIATLSSCAKHTGGVVFYYPYFTFENSLDVIKFSSEFKSFLSDSIGLEAVLRVRGSRGIQMTAYHGSFFLRSADLIQLPNVNTTNAFTVEMTLDENLTGGMACFQTALLHTSSSGVERSLSATLEDAREALIFRLIDIMSGYKRNCTSQGQTMQLLLPESLNSLPLFTLGILKSVFLREAKNINSDFRSYMLLHNYVSSIETNVVNIVPKFWCLSNIAVSQIGEVSENGEVKFPELLNLSADRLDKQGFNLLENGFNIFLWIGSGINHEMCQLLLNSDYSNLKNGKV